MLCGGVPLSATFTENALPPEVAGVPLRAQVKALIVDGNCTGGLIALELAARAVERGAPFALAGALSYVDTVNQVIYSNSRLLSLKGCFPFLDTGSGTVRSDESGAKSAICALPAHSLSSR